MNTTFALSNGQIMTPVVDCAHGLVVAAREHSAVLGNDVTLSDNHEVPRVATHAHRAVGKGRRDAVAAALERHETGRRDPLRHFDEASKGDGVFMRCACSSAHTSNAVGGVLGVA